MSESSPRFFKVALMVLPIGVIIGTVVFMIMFFHNDEVDKREQKIISSHAVRYRDLDDMVGKLITRIGDRTLASEEGRNGLIGASSMTKGRLGPANVGYNIYDGEGTTAHGRIWKPLWVEIVGAKRSKEIVFVVGHLNGQANEADATRLSTQILLAASMAKNTPERTIRFVFLPTPASDQESNALVLEQCLKSGETCHAILGVKTSNKAELITSQSKWSAETYGQNGAVAWEYLQGKVTQLPSSEAEGPALWLSHVTFSPHALQQQRRMRLELAEKIAPELSNFIMKLAGKSAP